MATGGHIGFDGGQQESNALATMRARLAEQEALAAAEREQWRKRNAEAAQRQREAKAEEEAGKEQRIREMQAAAFDREYRDRALEKWQGNGGTAAEFEKVWPGMRAELLTEKTKLDMVQARQNQAHLYSDF